MSRRTPAAVTTVDLPSGRTLEIVHPRAGAAYTRVKPPAPSPDRDLAVCAMCDSDLVEPTRWERAGDGHWALDLRCPNCEHSSAGVYSDECVDSLDERLDAGAMLIVRDLGRFEHANMTDDVERFIRALHADAILPEDFDPQT